MNRMWQTFLRIRGAKERVLRKVMPSRLHFVHYSWPLLPQECPCDVDFCEYLVERDIRGKAIFHFGTGGHHRVGLHNQTRELANDILGLTISPAEHQGYLRRIIRNPALARHYKVLFADLYSLSDACLPCFDIVTLFHLCEFADPGSAARRIDDAGALELLRSKLRPDGLLLLYPGSHAFKRVAPLVEPAVAAGRLVFLEQYRNLLIYRARRDERVTALAAP